jgi:HK97 family phage major capsid protein
MLEKELLENKIEFRKLNDNISEKKISVADAVKKLNELRTKRAELEKKIALRGKPKSKGEGSANFADVKKAMVEKRAVTLNETGAINQIKELTKELQKKTPVLNMVRYFYGPNASTNIPIWGPTIAEPGGYAEGASAIAEDTQGSLGEKMLQPRAFVSLLKVSAEAINLGSVNIESELPTIFADAFAQAFHNQILTGSGAGNNFKGIFTTTAANSANIMGNATVMNLVNLALILQDYMDDAVIIMHPTIYSTIMQDITSRNADVYQEEIARSKTIEGVKLILTTAAPNSQASGSVIAVGGRGANFGFAMASEIQIEPIRVKGDTNTYFQAMVFANGGTIIDKEFIGLQVDDDE